MRKIVRSLIEWVVIIAVAFGVSMLLRQFVVDVRVVPTPSMAPTIQVQDRVVVDRLFYKMGSLERGDIIVFTAPARKELEDLQGEDLVKRLIGLPGETVEVRDGHVWIDGRALNEPYVINPQGLTQYKMEPVTVPEGYYFVMGDNREGSNDSHNWGCLEQNLVHGRVWIRPWPMERLGPLAQPPEDYYLDLRLE
ncbi:MAG: signal peptidase I [Peptococcaceae bacterium]|nr:signal peptidase I [Peptococcaceae bacterium]